MRFSMLSEKEVINLCNGEKMGYICDLELDGCGNIRAVFVDGNAHLFSFQKKKKICIPWDRIDRIGSDAVLVTVAVQNEEGEK